MKKLILSIAFVLVAFFVNAQDFNHVLISKELVNNKPAIIYVNYGAQFYLTFRDGKRQIDYKLKSTGSHMNMGYISYAFSAILPNNKEVSGLKIFLVTNDGANSSAPPTLEFEIDGKIEKTFNLKAL
ncbi:hypothetical protein DBR40_20010 [Pedobacter sp. KBW01]|uniref:hypothetical protein n=1 Tax=Pedobacter sp. KBW01 TaxID=2153364 RepID=UPI000F599F55|nr:hypothetical protein [Pedobacter sp. KBW01]RQO68529.1 hypothetical protein DBR40_20010 [Pedobacter sp. KBW01]